MKAIILISSIFYILGLKISNQIDLNKKAAPVKKAIIQSVKTPQKEKTVDFKEAQTQLKETEAAEKSDCKDTE